MSDYKTLDVAQFGDFQTPVLLADMILRILSNNGINPDYILEPTCGKGIFLEIGLKYFSSAKELIGVDINHDYIVYLSERLDSIPNGSLVKTYNEDFFKVNWQDIFSHRDGEWLILGNPPWVTSSQLGFIGSNNLPKKANFQQRNGLDALTGKSNFDISEWMILQYLSWLNNKIGTISVLCKFSVARKILQYCWKSKYPVRSASIVNIDAKKHFNVSVDACLFTLILNGVDNSYNCNIYGDLSEEKPSYSIAYHNDMLIANEESFLETKELMGKDNNFMWRSGIKHDCSKVMELRKTDDGYINGFNEVVNLEDRFIYPLLKSSDVANKRINPRYLLIVTQQFIGEDTSMINQFAPETWLYLQKYADLLNKRSSSIYKNRPLFSIFGIGPYSFAPWKIAVSSLYKNLNFVKVGPENGRPTVFDDTVYFIACQNEEEADFILLLLESDIANKFYKSMIFWSDKRPITIDILKRLDLKKVAEKLNLSHLYTLYSKETRLIQMAIEV